MPTYSGETYTYSLPARAPLLGARIRSPTPSLPCSQRAATGAGAGAGAWQQERTQSLLQLFRLGFGRLRRSRVAVASSNAAESFERLAICTQPPPRGIAPAGRLLEDRLALPIPEEASGDAVSVAARSRGQRGDRAPWRSGAQMEPRRFTVEPRGVQVRSPAYGCLRGSHVLVERRVGGRRPVEVVVHCQQRGVRLRTTHYAYVLRIRPSPRTLPLYPESTP